MQASFQCPDSGLIVNIVKAVPGWKAEGDPDDWRDMGASASDIDNTKAWIEAANRALARASTREEVQMLLCRRPFNLDPSDLDELWW